jgi:hypothetical protein
VFDIVALVGDYDSAFIEARRAAAARRALRRDRCPARSRCGRDDLSCRPAQSVIVLLCGGDKSTQDRDIRAAKALAKAWRT